MYSTIIALIVCFVLSILILVYAISLIIGLIWARGVPFVSLSKKQLRAVDKNIKLKPNDKVVDLGCGDARVLRMFEKQGVKDLTGYEINFWAYLMAKIKNKLLKSKSKVYFKNFKKVDLSKYNVIFCYLLDNYLNSLKEKFDKELKSGTKIISYSFSIKNWHKPEKIERMFVYRI